MIGMSHNQRNRGPERPSSAALKGGAYYPKDAGFDVHTPTVPRTKQGAPSRTEQGVAFGEGVATAGENTQSARNHPIVPPAGQNINDVDYSPEDSRFDLMMRGQRSNPRPQTYTQTNAKKFGG